MNAVRSAAVYMYSHYPIWPVLITFPCTNPGIIGT